MFTVNNIRLASKLGDFLGEGTSPNQSSLVFLSGGFSIDQQHEQPLAKGHA